MAILDADKRVTSGRRPPFIQTIGRAARNADGLVVMYADSITPSMRRAIDETERRRAKQDAFNREHGIVPKTVIKSVRDVIDSVHDKRRAVSEGLFPKRSGRLPSPSWRRRCGRRPSGWNPSTPPFRDRIIELRGHG